MYLLRNNDQTGDMIISSIITNLIYTPSILFCWADLEDHHMEVPNGMMTFDNAQKE